MKSANIYVHLFHVFLYGTFIMTHFFTPREKSVVCAVTSMEMEIMTLQQGVSLWLKMLLNLPTVGKSPIPVQMPKHLKMPALPTHTVNPGHRSNVVSSTVVPSLPAILWYVNDLHLLFFISLSI